MSHKRIRFTLTAIQRGVHKRGATICTTKGSAAYKSMHGDPAWAESVMAEQPAPFIVGTDAKAGAAYRNLLTRFEEQGNQVAALSPDELKAYQELLVGHVDDLRELFDRAVPDPEACEFDPNASGRGDDDLADDNDDDLADVATHAVAPNGTETKFEPGTATTPADQAPPTDEQVAAREAAHVALVTTLGNVIGETDSDTTIAAMTELATAAGVTVPDSLPRTRVGVADVLYELANPSPAPAATDLGD